MPNKIFIPNTNNYFTINLIDDVIRPMVVILPGGGYDHTSKREADNVGLYFQSMGINYTVLNYRETIYKYPEPQEEVGYVFNYLIQNKDEFKVDTSKLLLIGFSAGGHLALSYSLYHEEFGSVMPSLLILSYPVVTSDSTYSHKSSFEYLIDDESLYDKLSLEKHIRKDLCDVFLWHTVTDKSVPCYNSIELLKNLYLNDINVEAHIFPLGPHGLSLADKSSIGGNIKEEYPYISRWKEMLKEWLRLKNII